MPRPRNILVGYDGSDSARRALDRAAALVGYGSVLTVVSVDGPEALAEARERLLSRQVSALYVDRAGEVDETLIEKARELDADLAQWARETFPAIVDEYVRPGRVQIVFRGLAFIGPESEAALRTALAAGAQGRLWNVVHLLYRNQGAENGGWVTDDFLHPLGHQVRGLNPEQALEERHTPSVDRELAAAARAAEASGVSGTPSFEAGPTGGALALVGRDEIPARLDALLAE